MKTHLKSDEELLLPLGRAMSDGFRTAMERAEESMARHLEAALYFDNGPEERAARLRQSVTGEKPPSRRITGLDAALPRGKP